MTQCHSNCLDRERDGKVARKAPLISTLNGTEELGELLDRVRHYTLLILTDCPRTPQVLRVRAGEVSVEIEWAKEHVFTASSDAEAAVMQSVVPVVEPVTETDPEMHYLTSPAVGVFYRAPEPGAVPFVSEGDAVVAGQQVGTLEAMKLMIPIEADKTGRIVEVLKNDGEPVEYGERLFVFAAVSAV